MVEGKYIAVIDQGTTSTRCIIFDPDGKIVSSEYAEHEQIYPRAGWVEHNPSEILEKTRFAIRRSLETAGVHGKQIAGVGITNQRETTIIWDKASGKPVYNAIVWQDTRTNRRCAAIRENAPDDSLIHLKTGLYPHPYFSSSKIEWILNNVPAAHEKAKNGDILFGNIDTWIIWNLTRGAHNNPTPEQKGAHLTDYTNASRTMLFDIERLEWSEDLLQMFNIPSEIMPQVRPSSDRESFGHTSADGPFGYEVPIFSDLGDQQAALVGQACFDPGEAKNTYGTGCFLLANLGDRPKFSKRGLLTTIAFGFEEGHCAYALEGSVAIAGAAVQWLRDSLNIITSSAETETMAKSVSMTGSGGVYFVPAFSGLFVPYWDTDARGIVVGLTRYTRREHLVHATLESICWQTRDVYDVMTDEMQANGKTLKVDGGAARNDYLMQLQADILGINVVRPVVTETTSLGAAYAAGLAVDLWPSKEELREICKIDRTFVPRWDDEKREKLHDGWRAAVKRSLGWLKEVGDLPPSGTAVN
jgi:glycerol kinase